MLEQLRRVVRQRIVRLAVGQITRWRNKVLNEGTKLGMLNLPVSQYLCQVAVVIVAKWAGSQLHRMTNRWTACQTDDKIGRRAAGIDPIPQKSTAESECLMLLLHTPISAHGSAFSKNFF